MDTHRDILGTWGIMGAAENFLREACGTGLHHQVAPGKVYPQCLGFGAWGGLHGNEVSFKRFLVGLAVLPGDSGKIHTLCWVSAASGCAEEEEGAPCVITLTISLEGSFCVVCPGGFVLGRGGR